MDIQDPDDAKNKHTSRSAQEDVGNSTDLLPQGISGLGPEYASPGHLTHGPSFCVVPPFFSSA